MKKLAVFGLAVAMAFNVNAQQEETGAAGSGTTAGAGLGTIGGIATGTIVAGAVAAGVLAAVVSNNRSDSLPIVPPTPTATCNAGDAAPVNNVCTGTTSTVTVTATGTGTGTATSTTTVTVPVTFTYAARVQ